MLCMLCLIVLWGFSLVTSYSGVKIHVLLLEGTEVYSYAFQALLYRACRFSVGMLCTELYASTKAQHGASEIRIQPRLDSSLHI